MVEITKKLTTQIISVLQIVLSVISIVTLTAIIILIFLNSKYRPSSDLDPSFVTELFGSTTFSYGIGFGTFLLILGIIFNLVTLDLGVVLWNAAKTKNWARCSDWLIGQSLMVGISIVIFILQLLFLPTSIFYVFKGVVGISLNLFFIWSVSEFVKEIRGEDQFTIATATTTDTSDGVLNGSYGWTMEIGQMNLDRPPRPGPSGSQSTATTSIKTSSAKETQID